MHNAAQEVRILQTCATMGGNNQAASYRVLGWAFDVHRQQFSGPTVVRVHVSLSAKIKGAKRLAAMHGFVLFCF